MKRLLIIIFILMAIWINIFTIDYMRVYHGNKPLFYWSEDRIKKICGDKSYYGFGYIVVIDRYAEENIYDGYTCHETGKFKVCPLFTDCTIDN